MFTMNNMNEYEKLSFNNEFREKIKKLTYENTIAKKEKDEIEKDEKDAIDLVRNRWRDFDSSGIEMKLSIYRVLIKKHEEEYVTLLQAGLLDKNRRTQNPSTRRFKKC